MRVFDHRRLRTALLAVVLWSSGGAFAAPIPMLEHSVLKLPPNQLTAYTGTAVLVQSMGSDVVTFDFKADALYLTGPAGHPRSLLTARYLRSVGGGETFGTVDRYSILPNYHATLILKPTDAKVYELNDHMHMLNVYLPWETLPTFAIPEAGKKTETREKISVLNLADVEAALRTRVAAKGGSLEITRELAAEENLGFSFRDNEANLVLYRQKYTIGRETGRVEALESDCAFEFSQGDTKIRLERKVRLKEASSTVIDGPGAPAWTRLIKEDLPAIEKGFTDRQSSEDIGKRLAGFAKSAEGTPLAALSGALQFRLEAFQQFFEATEAGRVLAGVLNRKAPDFTLKDLDGKDVAFRAAAAKNKVTLLSFWGYG